MKYSHEYFISLQIVYNAHGDCGFNNEELVRPQMSST